MSRTYCTRCVFHSDVPGVTFDEQGVCNLCRSIEQFEEEYPNDERGDALLDRLVREVKAAGRNKKYDCIVGVSGGCDSSYLLYRLVDLGLRPLAVHYDNTWNSEIATHNIKQMTGALDVDLFTIVVNNKEMDGIVKAFFESRLLSLNGVTDIGLASTMYRAAQKYGIKYQMDGHSFRTEGVSPMSLAYFDSRLVDDVVRRHGDVRIRTLPTLHLGYFLYCMTVLRLKRFRPLYYMRYDKEAAKQMLIDDFGWKWYGGHHLEDKLNAFSHSYLQPHTMGVDQRVNGFAALVRSGQMDRGEAIDLLSGPTPYKVELVEYFKARMGYSDEEFEEITSRPMASFRDYKSYKATFERMRPFFWLMYKMDLVPKSFYIKFCNKNVQPR